MLPTGGGHRGGGAARGAPAGTADSAGRAAVSQRLGAWCTSRTRAAKRLGSGVHSSLLYLSPPEDEDGEGFCAAFLYHVIFLLALPTLWHLIAYLAKDEATLVKVARPYTAHMPFILLARVAIHHIFDTRDAPKYALYLFTGVLSAGYVSHSMAYFYSGEPPEPIRSYHRFTEHGVGALFEPAPVPIPEPPTMTRAALHTLEPRCWAYLLEVPNMALMGWGYVGIRLLGGLSANQYVLTSLLTMALIAINTYREWTPAGWKTSFHAHLSLPQFAAYVSLLWLAFVFGVRTGARLLAASAGRPVSRLVPASAAVAAADRAVPPLAPAMVANLMASLECSITCERFVDPVLASDGHTYERSAIKTWLAEHATSPLTRQPMAAKLRPNLFVRGLLEL